MKGMGDEKHFTFSIDSPSHHSLRGCGDEKRSAQKVARTPLSEQRNKQYPA